MTEPVCAHVLPDALLWDERGLIPAIVQDAATGAVMTLAYMNREALRLTLEQRQVWLWSRTRHALWHKGATSGNVQHLCEIRADCDGDALLVRVRPSGPACHTGATSCFFRLVEGSVYNGADTRGPTDPGCEKGIPHE